MHQNLELMMMLQLQTSLIRYLLANGKLKTHNCKHLRTDKSIGISHMPKRHKQRMLVQLFTASSKGKGNSTSLRIRYTTAWNEATQRDLENYSEKTTWLHGEIVGVETVSSYFSCRKCNRKFNNSQIKHS